ncbi:MAG: DUF6152 family protein [Gammaproteobacteria bacterium]|nr:DUF6152 family protein [Gammaproteobacteria bacterium]
MRKKTLKIVLAVSFITAGFLGPAAAHHSHSMFDLEQEITITGIVTSFMFRNPHCFLYVDVEDESGTLVNYWIEMAPIPRMIQNGVGIKTFQPGDPVTVNMHPLNDGRPGGNYITIVAADGNTYD